MAVTEIVEPVREKRPTTGRLGRRQATRMSPLAPAYYLGRPARVWHEALQPRTRA